MNSQLVIGRDLLNFGDLFKFGEQQPMKLLRLQQSCLMVIPHFFYVSNVFILNLVDGVFAQTHALNQIGRDEILLLISANFKSNIIQCAQSYGLILPFPESISYIEVHLLSRFVCYGIRKHLHHSSHISCIHLKLVLHFILYL